MTAYKGLGTYGNAVGVVTPLDHKLSNAAMVVKQSGNLIRPGLFWGGNATIVSGKANMSYDVAAYSCATTRGATSGAVFGGNDGVLNVATTAAPGSNSRYDVIYHWHREYSLDGVDSNPVIGVIQGTAAASPTVPSLAAFPGAIEIGRVLVPAGVTATNTGTTITQTASFTAMAGGIVNVRNATELTAWTALDNSYALQMDTNSLYQRVSGSWILMLSEGPWVTATLAGSWSTLGAPFRYRRVGDMVELTGSVKSGSGTITTLPPGFTTAGGSATLYFITLANNGVAQIGIASTGVVSLLGLFAGGTNAIVSLDGVRFPVN